MADQSFLLQVEHLSVTFMSRRDPVRAVQDASFVVDRERLGIVGESGSGKSTMGRAILGIVPRGGVVTAGTLSFQGRDLRGSHARAVRGSQISMIMQDPKYSLNPRVRVGEQIAEAFLIHAATGRAAARQRALEMLAAVQIRDPELAYGLYPHQVSGGMGQRIMIAMMLVCEPALLIADEPTSALDVTVQLQILAIIDQLVERRGMGFIFISHNLNLVASFCDRVLIMRGGCIVDACAARDLAQSTHPYTRRLLAAVPRIEGGLQTPQPPLTRPTLIEARA
jgi:peptide/nickel transport system ATP-binding protein